MAEPNLACPACGRLFKNAHGRGGHLTTVNDPPHESYRAAHGLPAKTPRATIAKARKEAKTLAADGVAKSKPAAPPLSPAPPNEPAHPALAAVAPPASVEPPPPPGVPSEPPSSGFQAVVQDFLREARDNPPPPKPKKPESIYESEEPEPIMSDGAAVLAGAGLAAGAIALCKLVASFKGAKKPAATPPEPAQPQVYGLPPPPPPPKPQDMPAWMSSLNGSMPLPGGLPPGQQREWWWL